MEFGRNYPFFISFNVCHICTRLSENRDITLNYISLHMHMLFGASFANKIEIKIFKKLFIDVLPTRQKFAYRQLVRRHLLVIHQDHNLQLRRQVCDVSKTNLEERILVFLADAGHQREETLLQVRIVGQILFDERRVVHKIG